MGVDSSSSYAVNIPSMADEAVSSGDGDATFRPRRERTQHSRPVEGLERSVIHNEWAKGYYYLQLSISCVFWLVLCCGGRGFGCRACVLIVLMNSLSLSWTKGCAGGSGVLVCVAGVGFRPRSCSFGADS